MIAAQNEKRVVLYQKVVSAACFIVVLSSIGVLGAYSAFHGGNVDLSVMPRVNAELTQNERNYIEDVRVFTGGGEVGYAVSMSENDVPDVKEVDSVVVVIDSISDDSTIIRTEMVVQVSAVGTKKEIKNVERKEIETKPTNKARASASGVPTLESARLALINKDYAGTLKILANVPPVDDAVYMRAVATYCLFRKGEASGRDVITVWQKVKSKNIEGSKRYNEADSVLNLFIK